MKVACRKRSPRLAPVVDGLGALGNKPLPPRLFFPKLSQYQMVLLGEKRYRFVLECGATGENGGVR
jgi:hypothetical protein